MKKILVVMILYTSSIYSAEHIILQVIPSHKTFTKKALIVAIKEYARKLNYMVDDRWLKNVNTIETILLPSIPMRNAQRRTSGSDIHDDLLTTFKTGSSITTVQTELMKAAIKSLQTYYKEKDKKSWQPVLATHTLTTLTFKHNETEIASINNILLGV